MIVRPHPEGAVVTVWVVPGASRPAVVGPYGDAVKVRVAAPPERGKANAEVCRLLCDRLHAASAEVIGGHASRRKQVVVRGVAPEEAAELLG